MVIRNLGLEPNVPNASRVPFTAGALHCRWRRYRCEETLEWLFEGGAVVGGKAARIISGRRPNGYHGPSAADNRAALAFFLDRTTRARALFGGRRLQDVRMPSYGAAPLTVAAAAGDPAAVALLLRYGVDEPAALEAIAYLRDGTTASAAANASTAASTAATAAATAATADYRTTTMTTPPPPLGAGARSCLDVLLRAVAHDRRSLAPPSLLHLARHAVRRALHDDFGLPHRVPLLPVPRSLVPYLHLEC